jgi:hypothetical protein
MKIINLLICGSVMNMCSSYKIDERRKKEYEEFTLIA